VRGLTEAIERHLGEVSPLFKGLTEKYAETCRKRKRGQRGMAKTYSFTAEIDDETLLRRLEETDCPETWTAKKPKLASRAPSDTRLNLVQLTDSVVASSKLQKPLQMLLPQELQKIKAEMKPVLGLARRLEFAISSRQIGSLEVVCQVQSKFIIARTQSDPLVLVAVDQHAAHERVLLERYQRSLESLLEGEPVSEVITTSAFDIGLLKATQTQLKQWHWDFRLSETDEVHVTQVPKLLGSALLPSQLTVFADQLGSCPQLMLR
jgi:DNA mismatch repair ATPase MutL